MPEIQKRTILDISEDILEFKRLVEYNDDDMSDELEIKLSELQLEAQEKILAVGAWYKNIEMELEGIKLHKKEVDARIKSLKGLRDRLKKWVFKGALMAGIVRGDSQKGWDADKLSNAQLKVSWRRSEGVTQDESAAGYEEMVTSYPDFFDWKIRVLDRAAGLLLMDLTNAGMLEILEKDFRKKEAGEYLKQKDAVPLSGLKLEKRINPQIK